MDKFNKLSEWLRRIIQFRWFWDALFVICFLLISFQYNYEEILFMRPQSIHAWRQTDGASFALNYYQRDLPLLEPEMHYLFNSEGKALGEFPIWYYAVGWLYRLFGYHEFLYRLLWWAIALLGSYSFFRFCYQITGRYAESLIGGLIIFSSPIMAYYSNNFISDPVAIYTSCMALLPLAMYYKKGKNTYLVAAVGLIILAGLSKITALIIPLTIMGIYMLYLVFERREFRKGLIFLLSIAVVLLVNFAWYSHAKSFNESYNIGYFLLNAEPIWTLPSTEIDRIWEMIRMNTIPILISYSFLIFLTVLVLNFLILVKGLAKKWIFSALLLAILAEVFYFILFFQKLDYHDYYFLIIYQLFALLYVGAIVLIKNRSMLLRTLLIICGSVAIYNNVRFSKDLVLWRYSDQCQGMFRNFSSYHDLSPVLTSLGIDVDDRVISIRDDSPNISLYLMNRRGWTNLYHVPMEPDALNDFILKGAKYLIVAEESISNLSELQPLIDHKVGMHHELSVYRLKSIEEPTP